MCIQTNSLIFSDPRTPLNDFSHENCGVGEGEERERMVRKRERDLGSGSDLSTNQTNQKKIRAD